MSKLAVLGGRPVTRNILSGSNLYTREDLEKKYLIDAYESGRWDDWPEDEKSQAAKFAKEWAAFNESKHCALLTNGTHTLQLALEALDVGYGDEVVVPGLTWQATASVVCDVNAVPVVVDIDPETLCIDPDKIEHAITKNTRAIIPVHLYGRMADLDRIMPIARKYKLHVIEDCAHTHGSRWKGRGAGTVGDFGSYSFQRSKLMTAGEGGALLMQKESLYWKIVSQRSCGREYRKGTRVHSGNYRMTSFQAAVLRGQLAAMKRNAPRFDKTGRALDKAVENAPGVRALRRNRNVTRQCGYGYVFLYDRNAFDGLAPGRFREALSAELGFAFSVPYAPLHKSPVYYPHTKKRHRLGKRYLDKIQPARMKLPVCDAMADGAAVLADWKIYTCAPGRTGLLGDAIAKIYENRKELFKTKLKNKGQV